MKIWRVTTFYTWPNLVETTKKMNTLYSNFVDCDKLTLIEIGEIISSVMIVPLR